MLHVTCIFWCVSMSVIRVRRDVYEELKKLKVKTGASSMSEVISLLLKTVGDKIDRFESEPDILLRSLKYAGEAGRRDSERLDELLYGAED